MTKCEICRMEVEYDDVVGRVCDLGCHHSVCKVCILNVGERYAQAPRL